MKTETIVGIVRKERRLQEAPEEYVISMPRPPEKAQMYFPLEGILQPFLGKMVKITIEEVRE